MQDENDNPPRFEQDHYYKGKCASAPMSCSPTLLFHSSSYKLEPKNNFQTFLSINKIKDGKRVTVQTCCFIRW